MRLSQWRAGAPHRDAMSQKVMAVLEPVLHALGCAPDPHVWVAWGDDPTLRYVVFAPTEPGLATCHVRVNVAGEGPRASGKIVRWNRAQLGELGIETQGGHRIVSFQAEGQILRGVDADADRVAAFALALFAAVDGRPLPDLGGGRGARAVTKPARKAGTKAAGTRPATPAAKAPTTSPKQPPTAASGRPAATASRTTRSTSAGAALTRSAPGRKPPAERG